MAAKLTPEQEEILAAHGIAFAGYNNLAYLARTGGPQIDCLCGASFCDSTFEEVGAQYDEHISQVKELIAA